MKAIVLERPGSTENFVYKEVPQPVIALNEVLVKVESVRTYPERLPLMIWHLPMIRLKVEELLGKSLLKYKYMGRYKTGCESRKFTCYI